MEQYLPFLLGRSVGLVVNHTSLIDQVHLVDTLLGHKVKVTKMFAPEHGLRGVEDAGEVIRDGIDTRTGIPVISLYGDKKKPSPADFKGIDIMVFDIQDVGVRFYTYISTLHYIMEACAASNIPLIVLDRPNPNGHYVDGPVLDTSRFRSFVGMHPIPVVYGMTIGELALMINGEQWIPVQCALTVIACTGYDHSTLYVLPVRPSPNLPDLRSVLLYPGICLFEGTVMSLGRGTAVPFQVVGHPDYPDRSFSFVPRSVPGATNPPLKDKTCYGIDLSGSDMDSLFSIRRMDLHVLLDAYKVMDKASFFNASWFDKLAGTSSLREWIIAGWGEDQIRAGWRDELKLFREKRKVYLLYDE